MNNKVLNALYIVVLAGVIGVMSWRDMHPTVSANSSKDLPISYYAGAGITPAMMPDDSVPITIGLGTFSYTRQGKVSWAPEGIKPTTIAQRQINLLYHFNNLPHSPAETIEIIKTTVDDWVHKGDTISILIFDYDAEKADLEAYAGFLAAAHEAFKKGYIIYSGINILWAEGPHKDILKDLHDSSPKFLIHVPKVSVMPEIFSKLQSLKYDFILQFPAGVRLEDIDVASLGKLDFLTGITLTLDPHKPLPKKDEQIGLFPKL